MIIPKGSVFGPFLNLLYPSTLLRLFTTEPFALTLRALRPFFGRYWILTMPLCVAALILAEALDSACEKLMETSSALGNVLVVTVLLLVFTRILNWRTLMALHAASLNKSLSEVSVPRGLLLSLGFFLGMRLLWENHWFIFYMWGFSYLFFIDAQPEKRSLWLALKQGFSMFTYLLPIVPLGILTAIFLTGMPKTITEPLAGLAGQSWICGGVIIFLRFFLGMLVQFFNLAVLHVMYQKTITDFPELFIDPISAPIDRGIQ